PPIKSVAAYGRTESSGTRLRRAVMKQVSVEHGPFVYPLGFLQQLVDQLRALVRSRIRDKAEYALGRGDPARQIQRDSADEFPVGSRGCGRDPVGLQVREDAELD